MIKNYLTIALRHITRNKGYFLVNVIGLGLGLALCIITFVNYQYFQQSDGFHERLDHIRILLIL